MTEERVTEVGAVLGSITATTHGQENWVGDRGIGYLKTGTTLIYGRWHRRDNLWAFAPENAHDVDTIRVQREWEILDGYWGERAELVLDRTNQWRKARFQATDAIRRAGPAGVWMKQATEAEAGGGEVIKDGWDHEHCAICWETLGPGGQAEGYFSAPQTWVCQRCYADFIERSSLDFIPSA